MSTTLNVLHMLMGGLGRDVDLGEHDVILGRGGGDPEGALDPALADFWSSFPCPPPWNHGLLFRVNWTACVGQAVGEQLKWFMADRCNIRFDDSQLLPGDETGEGGGGQQEEEELEAPEACALPCIIMIALAGLVFVLLVAGVVFCLCRTRPKHSSPTHQSALNAHPDHAKYYTSCHYASAPVMTRLLETTLRGDRPETRVLNSACSQPSPYHQQHHHHHHHHDHCLHVQGHVHPGEHNSHEALISLMAAGLSEQLPPPAGSLRQGELPLPPSRSVLSYRRLDGAAAGSGDYVSSSASQTNSDRSHIYESIGDGATESGSGTYLPHHDLQLLAAQGDGEMLPACVAADFCECDCGATVHAGPYDFGPLPGQLDGYYSDRSTQTLPVRPLRHVRDQESPFSGQLAGFDVEDALRPASGLSNRSRRRTSSGSHYSDRSAGYREGGQRRNIPALHPNYFDPPEPPEPDFSNSS